jgi:hypothetical protein
MIFKNNIPREALLMYEQAQVSLKRLIVQRRYTTNVIYRTILGKIGVHDSCENMQMAHPQLDAHFFTTANEPKYHKNIVVV